MSASGAARYRVVEDTIIIDKGNRITSSFFLYQVRLMLLINSY